MCCNRLIFCMNCDYLRSRRSCTFNFQHQHDRCWDILEYGKKISTASYLFTKILLHLNLPVKIIKTTVDEEQLKWAKQSIFEVMQVIIEGNRPSKRVFVHDLNFLNRIPDVFQNCILLQWWKAFLTLREHKKESLHLIVSHVPCNCIQESSLTCFLNSTGHASIPVGKLSTMSEPLYCIGRFQAPFASRSCLYTDDTEV